MSIESRRSYARRLVLVVQGLLGGFDEVMVLLGCPNTCGRELTMTEGRSHGSGICMSRRLMLVHQVF